MSKESQKIYFVLGHMNQLNPNDPMVSYVQEQLSKLGWELYWDNTIEWPNEELTIDDLEIPYVGQWLARPTSTEKEIKGEVR